jgi:DNA mismatch repair protein MutL
VERKASSRTGSLPVGHSQSFGRVLTIIARLRAAGARRQTALLALPVAERWLRQAQLTPGEKRYAPSRC